MTHYTCITPGRGCDGRFYVAADGSDRFSAYHLDMERERGNLREVEKVGVVTDEAAIPAGGLVCFGAEVTLWREVTP
jgi:hypothetical protein